MARRRSKRRRGSFSIRLKKSSIMSIFSVLFLLLSFISVFAFLREGLVMIKLNDLFWQYFGPVSFLIPFLFVLLAVFFSKLKIALREPNVLAGAILLFVSFLGLFKAGEIGLWMWQQVAVLITPIGSFLILAGGSMIGFVVLFNTSLEQIYQFFVSACKLIRKYTFAKKEKKAKQDFLFEEQGSTRQKQKPFEKLTSVIGQTKSVAEKGQDSQQQLSIQTTAVGSKTNKDWQYPPIEILRDDLDSEADRGDVRANAETIESTLESFGISAKVKEVNRGPAVTQYALQVSLGTKLSKVTSLSNDLALALAAPTGQIRIEAPIPGRSLIGIEVPNISPATVSLREMILSKGLKKTESRIGVPLGLDVSGEPVIADIKKMPHVLIAGQTGSGKSVLLNSWISTILFRASPNEVKLILIDPKRVELTRYNGIPHLLTPVIVEPDKVISSLKWAMIEMDNRYKLFSKKGSRNLELYNKAVPKEEKMPYILIVIDELADIMLFAPTEVEDTICRIAQMARATGIHLILTTQRPSVDVLTGLIKANIPSRISCAVSSMIDSRVILDTPGAEKLLGKGDMLFIPPDQAKPTRIQGAFVTDQEINNLIVFLKAQVEEVEYNDDVFAQPVSVSDNTFMVDGQERDEYFDQALELVRSAKKASASLIQRKMRVGYARAARILDQLEAAGIVGPPQGSKPREVIG